MQLDSSPLSVSKRHREDARSSGQSCQQRNGTGCGDSGGSSSSGCSKRIRFKLASDECETVPLGAWQANPIPLPLAESTAGGSCAGQRRKWQRLLLQQQLRLLECDGVSWCWVPALGLATAERERQLLLPLFSSVPPVPHAPLLDACPGRTVTGDHRAAEGEQQAKQCCDPDAPLPAKHTIGGQRYAVSQPNPRWDVRAAAAAAAAAAAELGVSVKARQPGSRRAKVAATAAAEHLAAPAAGGSSCSALQPAATASGEHGHCSEGECGSSSTLPASTATARFIVLMLAHETGAPAAAAWDAWEQAQGGAAAVLVHLKAGVELDEQQLPGCTWLRGRLLRSRTRSMWGDLSLTAAMLGACAEVLRHCPCACHVAVVSGLCVPAAPAPRLPAAVSLVGCFRFGRDFDAAAGRIAATLLRQDEPGIKPADEDAWQDSMICTATWMVMSRRLLLGLLSRQRELLAAGSALTPRFSRPDAALAADEFLLPSAALRYGLVSGVLRLRHATFVARMRAAARQRRSDGSISDPCFDAEGSVLLDCAPTLALFHPTATRHPHTWRSFDEELLCDVRRGSGSEAAAPDCAAVGRDVSLAAALALARPNGALFFRKVQPANEREAVRLLAALRALWSGTRRLPG